jgi:uncharacterized MAPEG superfamily protein
MTAPFFCVLIAYMLVIGTKGPISVAMARQPKGYDNRNPRAQQAALEGWGRRAVAAHQNTIEAFPPFAAAVLIAHVGGGDPTWATRLALLFIAARVSYPILYIADVNIARSAIWGVGVAAICGLILLPAFS